ncbi:MAG: FtsQ-type POTRA domain-containing protein, partial [Spirochaetes bacterium]|nr:FtsQ-type POTRA domain-containing protein [Spirochaetota bacterium]
MSNENRKYTDLQEDFYHTKMIIKGKKIMIVGSRIVSILLIITALVMLGQRSIDFIKRVNIFTLNDLIINGNAYLSFNDLLDIMDIKSGDNIFHVHLKKLKAKLELHPRIRSVSIKRELPDKIIINIVEREPIALVNTRKELNYRLYEIDAEGYVIGEFPDFSTYDLPVVTGDIFERIILGGRIKNKEFLDILSIVSKTEVKYYDFKR